LVCRGLGGENRVLEFSFLQAQLAWATTPSASSTVARVHTLDCTAVLFDPKDKDVPETAALLQCRKVFVMVF